MATKTIKTERKAVDKKEVLSTRIQDRSVLLYPYITEKTANLTEKGQYVFSVDVRANKPQVKREIEGLYGVRVTKVTCIRVRPQKTVYRRRHTGYKSGMKKAYIRLKKGQTIDVYTKTK